MKINRKKLVISLESELSSDGKEVAAALAKALKLKDCGDEILPVAAELSGISLKLLRRYEEKRVRHAYDLTADGEDTLHIPPARDFLTAQIAACRAIADRGACIITDHHVNTALSDRDDHIRIFVHAQRESRLARYASEKGQSPEQAAKRFAREDRERIRYFKGVNPKWGKASNYDLTVNSDSADPETLAEHIVQYLETVTGERLVHPTQAQKRSA